MKAMLRVLFIPRAPESHCKFLSMRVIWPDAYFGETTQGWWKDWPGVRKTRSVVVIEPRVP